MSLKAKPRTAAEAVQHVKWSERAGMLAAETVGVSVCDCCGEIMLVLHDKHGTAFVGVPLTAGYAMALAAQLVELHDKGALIKARLAGEGRH